MKFKIRLKKTESSRYLKAGDRSIDIWYNILDTGDDIVYEIVDTPDGMWNKSCYPINKYSLTEALDHFEKQLITDRLFSNNRTDPNKWFKAAHI